MEMATGDTFIVDAVEMTNDVHGKAREHSANATTLR
jgi:hypothetical protein